MPSTQELLDRAVEKLKQVNKEQFDTLEPQIKEALKAGRGVAELTEKFERANGEVAALTDQIKSLSETLNKERDGLNERIDEFERKYGTIDTGGRAVKSPGRTFVESERYKEISERNKSQVNVQDTGKIPVPNGFLLEKSFWPNDRSAMKDLNLGEGSAGALSDSLRLPGVITPLNITLSVQDLIPRTQTESGRVDYVRETGYTIGAAPVAESTMGNLVNKPQSNITFDLVEKVMRTIAHWVPASKQILLFSNRTQLQNYVDGRLRYGLNLELEDQILLGDGTGQNLDGLVPNAAVYNRGYANIQGAAPTKIDTLRRAMTQARLAEYPVTGMVLHPTDWEDITLTKGSDLHYIFASPGQMTTPRLWGVPVADSSRMNEGEFLVGAFALGAELFVGMEATVEVARQHANFFVQNMVAILAEMMALLAIYRPEAFITGGFEAGSGSGS